MPSKIKVRWSLNWGGDVFPGTSVQVKIESGVTVVGIRSTNADVQQFLRDNAGGAALSEALGAGVAVRVEERDQQSGQGQGQQNQEQHGEPEEAGEF